MKYDIFQAFEEIRTAMHANSNMNRRDVKDSCRYVGIKHVILCFCTSLWQSNKRFSDFFVLGILLT